VSVLLVVLHAAQAAASPALPFGVGERFDYGAKWNFLTVGKASMEIAGIDTVRDRETYHLRYTMEASIPFYSLVSTLESWSTTDSLFSLRFQQNNKEKERQFFRRFEIFPDSAFYRQIEPQPADSQPTVAEPLDDASVMYFIRRSVLEVGKTYRFSRYFRADRNPILLSVLKRETMELPDGTKVPCLVIKPSVGERGLFGPRADARLWLSDDARRIPVQIRSTQPYGTITLRLQKMSIPG